MLLLACAHSPPLTPGPSRVDELRAAATAAAPGWAHQVSESEGYGRTETWCTGGDGPAGCVDDAPVRGLRWRVLLETPGGWAWRAMEVPEEGSWGLRVDVDADRAALQFFRFAERRITGEILLGAGASWQIEQTELRAPGDPDPAELDRALHSDAAFRRWALAQVEALAGVADAALASGAVRKCSWGRYLGDGSPVCEPVPLSPAELGAWRQELVDRSARSRAWIEDEGPELRALARALWP